MSGAGELEGSDPARLRISDMDRHRVADILREAAAEGRLEMDELEERLEATYAAKVYGDLVPITADLPVAPAGPLSHPVPPHPPAALPVSLAKHGAGELVPLPSYQQSLAIFTGVDRKGGWQVPAAHTSFALCGAVSLDLRQARFTSAETVIYANAVWGAIEVVVNAETRVVVDGVGIMGVFEQDKDKVPPQLSAASPVVRVKGMALMGAVSVVRKPPPGTRRSLLRRR